MAPAKYVHRQEVGGKTQYLAVCSADTPLDKLRAIRDILGPLPGVERAGVGPAWVDDGSVRVVIVEVADGFDAIDVVTTMKELTKPELPFTIGTFDLTLLACTCGYISSRADIAFVPGLGPDDEEGFHLRYAAGVQKLALAEPIEEAVVAGRTDTLLDVLGGVLRSQGAHVIAHSARSTPDLRPCTHTR